MVKAAADMPAKDSSIREIEPQSFGVVNNNIF